MSADRANPAGGWIRRAEPVVVRDGTQLAAYVFRPATDGVVHPDPLPAVWCHNLYHDGTLSPELVERWRAKLPWLDRAALSAAPMGTVSFEHEPWLADVVGAGYVVVIVDVRGGGASGGTRAGPFAPAEADDAADVTSWLVAQPWCDGRVGMFGRSYMGANQFVAAAQGLPGLRAIFPEMALFDLYDFIYGGGIFRHEFARHWTRDVADRAQVRPIDRLDGDHDGAWAAAARDQHAGNRDVYSMLLALPHRDSLDPVTGTRPFIERAPGQRAGAVRASRVPVCQVAGWYDPFVRDAFQWFGALDGPQRLIVGPWAHSGSAGLDLGSEHVYWYDRWLKEVEPDDDEAPLHYHVMGAPPGERWRSAATWPPPGVVPTTWYLHAGPAQTVDSINDGALDVAAPPADRARDRYRVDYSTTSGTATRWTNAYGGPFGYGDLSGNDEKGLTYTSAALTEDLEVIGHPIVALWIECSAPDVDVFAYLEEVSGDGESLYVSEGALRASHRALAAPPVAALALPHHRSFGEDLAPLPADRPALLTFDLFPVARRFPRGSHVRLTLTCADADNALTPRLDPPPVLAVVRGAEHPSHLVLPVQR